MHQRQEREDEVQNVWDEHLVATVADQSDHAIRIPGIIEPPLATCRTNQH